MAASDTSPTKPAAVRTAAKDRMAGPAPCLATAAGWVALSLTLEIDFGEQ